MSVSVPDTAAGGIHLAASSLNLRVEPAPRLVELAATWTDGEMDAPANGFGWTCGVRFPVHEGASPMLNEPQVLSGTNRVDADASRTPRMVTAAALAGSAVLVGIGGLIAPPNDGQAAGLYDAASSAPGRLTAEAAVLVISSILLVVGVMGAARVVRGRGRRLALAAALFGVMGALGHVAYATFSLTTIRIVEAAPGRDAAIKTLDSINGDAAIGLLVMPLIVAYGLSVILLPIAFYRRRLVPLWVVGLAGMAFLLELVAPGDMLAVAGVKYALGAAATTALAWRITQLSNSEWRNPETIDRT